MVNEEKIGVYQGIGEKDWWQNRTLPSNVTAKIIIKTSISNDRM
jgi:hypothetical protein